MPLLSTLALAALAFGVSAAPAPQQTSTDILINISASIVSPSSVSSSVSSTLSASSAAPSPTGAINSTVLFNQTANYTSSTVAGNRTCWTFVQNVTASANNLVLDVDEPVNQQAMLAQSYINAQETAPFFVPTSNGTCLINGTYEIYFQYCEPTAGATKPSVLHTIHGLVGTAGYWDASPGGNETYSFVQAVTDAGYAVLSYDRLGVGNSSKPDGIQIVQLPLQVALALEITSGLRTNTLGLNRTFSSVVGVGHSFGSAILVGASGAEPTAFDGLVLTGFAANATVTPLKSLLTFQNTIANTLANTTTAGESGDWAGLPNSYLVTASQSGDQLGFFSYPNYTQEAIDSFTATKGTYTLGELLSQDASSSSPSNYTNPLQVVTGDHDAPFCGGNCYDVPANVSSQLDSVFLAFPSLNATNFNTYVVPGTAHAINFHPTAPVAYAEIIAFLAKYNL